VIDVRSDDEHRVAVSCRHCKKFVQRHPDFGVADLDPVTALRREPASIKLRFGNDDLVGLGVCPLDIFVD
jgi:hypothetical protein